MPEYFEPDELDGLRDVAVEQFPDQATVRPLLFQRVNRRYAATLPVIPSPGVQVTSDLMHMNGVERLVDASVPLEDWLRSAVRLTLDRGARTLLERALDTVASAAAGEPDLGVAGDVSEVKEEIIFRDDTLEIGFLAAGAEASLSVGLITVQPYEKGGVKLTPLGAPENPHAGTCWLVGPDLVMTNHHVVNARSALEGDRPLADEADLRRQGSTAIVQFDYDADPLTGTGNRTSELLAWDEHLDYAVLRLADPAGRPPLPLMNRPLKATTSDNVAVNVLQHPGGGPKRVGLRNNVVEDTTDRDVRYFTDTRSGSSGSPVLTDGWRVCALHRGSKRVDVKFQGKTSAYVNVGTQIWTVLADIERRFPAVRQALPG